jgi:hypothetical protein
MQIEDEMAYILLSAKLLRFMQVERKYISGSIAIWILNLLTELVVAASDDRELVSQASADRLRRSDRN